MLSVLELSDQGPSSTVRENSVISRMDSLAVAATKSPETFQAALAAALQDESSVVRRNALDYFAWLVEEDVLSARFAQAVNDSDPEVQRIALEILEQQKPDVKWAAIRAASLSANSPTKYRFIDMLTEQPSRDSFLVLLSLFDDSDIDHRVAIEVKRIVGRQFNSSEEASTWWKKENQKFDVFMLRIED